MNTRRLIRWLRRLLLAALAAVCVLRIAWLLLPRVELLPRETEYSRETRDRDGRLLHLAVTHDGKYRLPANLDTLSPLLVEALLEMEDRRFYSHVGTDALAVCRAAWGVVSGQRLGGGSTITMQVARLRWRLNTRTTGGKLTQMFRAAQIERHYSKREILEAYFTLAPYGGNVEGVEAASLLWCGKPSHDLTLREAAALTVIPQSPAARRPRAGSNVAAPAQARLMARLHVKRGEIPDAMDAEFSLRPAGVPRRVPHAARRAQGRTTIDSAQQEAVESSIAVFLERWRARGIRNAAAVLVHAPSREIRVYAGSADFFDPRIAGQVDGITARRSPGSALKPFIHALALDEGLIHPRTLLDDTLRRFAGYNPENSDRGFLGPVSADEALRRSRNVPSVELASRLRPPGLDGFLRASGARLVRAPGDYGLSLALGGAEVSLEELARLYAMLAHDGVPRPLTLASEGSREGGRALLTPAARWLTLAALRNEAAPGAPAGLAWKTGTSHGFRDAWACGVRGEWVLCVWVGNFDATPMHGLFARDTAAPLLFQTVARLGLRGGVSARPAGVVDAELCADSGALACPHCPNRARGPFIAGVSPIATCTVHREVVLADGRRVVREFWPAERLVQFRLAGLPRTDVATQGIAGAPPRIVSPQAGVAYVVHRGVPGKDTVPLEANAAAGVRQIHWFAGLRYLGASVPAQPLHWQAAPGRWILEAVDDAGRTARVSVTISAGYQDVRAAGR